MLKKSFFLQLLGHFVDGDRGLRAEISMLPILTPGIGVRTSPLSKMLMFSMISWSL